MFAIASKLLDAVFSSRLSCHAFRKSKNEGLELVVCQLEAR